MRFRESIKTGLNFGFTSGVITTLGLVVGLHAGTHSLAAVVGGILTIAVADSLSDALGIHISKEAEAQTTQHEVWVATLATFAAKMLMSASFLVPVLLLDLTPAVVASVIWGMAVIAVVSYVLARDQGDSAWRVIGEHLLIAAVVVICTHLLGNWVAQHIVQ